MWQLFLWATANWIAFTIWSSLSQANERMEADLRPVPARRKQPLAD